MLTKYVYANGKHIAKIVGADTHYYHCDALGSPRKMTDENGVVRWQTRYYPFGEMSAASDNNMHGFTPLENPMIVDQEFSAISTHQTECGQDLMSHALFLTG